MNPLYSIIRTHKRLKDDEKEIPALGKRWPVMWHRVGEPYHDVVDAHIDLQNFEHPEDYIILPHY